MKKALFIFRRDLRLEDNTGLIFALKNADKVIPAFIFTPEQINRNPYKGNHCLQFMIESLEDLEDQLKKKRARLYLFFAKPEEVVKKCIEKLGIDAVIINRDYTPYSIARDRKIESLCKKRGIAFHSFDDALLHPPAMTLKSDGKPYTLFTPYYRNALKLDVERPKANRFSNYFAQPIPFAKDSSLYRKILPHREKQSEGGRKAALKILKKIARFSNYKSARDVPAKNATTHLSPHLKFTTCSPREVYQAIKRNSELKRSLYWRDFFTMVAFYFPKVFKGAFHEKFNGLRWKYDRALFKGWCEGKTGFPIVDAGMREMNQTGFMQNRVRMIVASFLVKDLHIDWRWGEKYFAQKLIDYDPAVNNGNWQWAASTGCDAQPYFRIFNPWAQQKKFDKDCAYIKRWIPELASEDPKSIHEWYKQHSPDYPPPLVDHAKEAKKTLQSYRSAASKGKH
jgi:deoxyribodipyrimidine photo-lyase